MEFRPGTCSACKASFRIPATFSANKAKCSKCGGVVEIGPVTSDAAKPAAMPAKSVSAPVAGAAARLAAKPEASPSEAAPKPVPARPVPAAVPQKSAVPAKPAAPAKLTPAAAKNAAAPTKPMPNPAARATAKPAAVKTPVSTKAPHPVGEDDEDHGHARRRALLEKKRGMNPMLVVGALLALVVIGGGVFYLYKQNEEASRIQAEKVAAVKAANAEKARLDEERLAAENLTEEQRKQEAAAAKAAQKTEEGAAVADAKAEAKAKAATDAAEKASKPLEGFDLSTIPDFGPLEGTTDEQWTELQSLAATFMDFSAGARAGRAGSKLEATPKESFPAILNAFKKLDLSTDEGFRNADATAKMLERICHGNNLGWRYQHEKDWLAYDQKVIKAWCDQWTKASTDEAYWRQLSKQDADAKPIDAGEGGDAKPAAPKKLDDF